MYLVGIDCLSYRGKLLIRSFPRTPFKNFYYLILIKVFEVRGSGRETFFKKFLSPQNSNPNYPHRAGAVGVDVNVDIEEDGVHMNFAVGDLEFAGEFIF